MPDPADPTTEPPLFTVSVSGADTGRAVVAAAGELDIATVPEFLRAVAGLAPLGLSAIVVDLSALTFIDSSGINALAGTVRRMQANGVTTVLAAPSERVQRVFEMVRLDEILPLERSLADAFERTEGRAV